jgi:chemotaxis protein CheD
MKVSDDPEVTLVAHSLGSCVGVAVYDPEVRVGGLLHFLLPESSDADKAKERPFMFAQTGIPLFLESCYELGVETHRMVVKIAGGTEMLDATETSSLGRRNHAAVKDIFSRHRVAIETEDVGGGKTKTLRLSIATGDVTVKHPDEDYMLL